MTKLYLRPFDVILNQSWENPGFLFKKQSEYNMQKKKPKPKKKKKNWMVKLQLRTRIWAQVTPWFYIPWDSIWNNAQDSL